MAANNCVHLIGWLSDEPETRTVGDNIVTKFRLGVKHPFKKDKFINVHCSAWGNTGKFVSGFHKGGKIAVEGYLSIDTVERDGNKTSFTEVVVSSADYADSKPKSDDAAKSAPSGVTPDDELPW